VIGLLALTGGYLLGATPTADWLAGLKGVDLRATGSGNPGANNARRVGGLGLGVAVLLVEIVKGAAIVAIGRTIGAEWGMALAGVGAVAGNIWNPFRRFSGGQGLGITAGVLIAAAPLSALAVVIVIAGVAVVTHSAPVAALSALGMLVLASLATAAGLLPSAWGTTGGALAALVAGLVAAIAPKQVRNARADRLT
jgi:glycerol-3-phosphate acyltransferase PlsY